MCQREEVQTETWPEYRKEIKGAELNIQMQQFDRVREQTIKKLPTVIADPENWWWSYIFTVIFLVIKILGFNLNLKHCTAFHHFF